MSYFKITYVEKYNNPCLRGLFVLFASSIYLYGVIPIARVSLGGFGSLAFQLPIPEPLQILLSVSPTILYTSLYPQIVTLIIMAGEWFLSLPTLRKIIKFIARGIKFIARRIRRVYHLIVDWNNSW
jgi:hypothetical protein